MYKTKQICFYAFLNNSVFARMNERARKIPLELELILYIIVNVRWVLFYFLQIYYHKNEVFYVLIVYRICTLYSDTKKNMNRKKKRTKVEEKRRKRAARATLVENNKRFRFDIVDIFSFIPSMRAAAATLPCRKQFYQHYKSPTRCNKSLFYFITRW